MNNNYSLLEDPNNIFDCPSGITQIANTPDGSALFLYCAVGFNGTLFSWDEINYFRIMKQIEITGPMVTDVNNNLYAPITNYGHRSKHLCPLAMFDASNQYSSK